MPRTITGPAPRTRRTTLARPPGAKKAAAAAKKAAAAAAKKAAATAAAAATESRCSQPRKPEHDRAAAPATAALHAGFLALSVSGPVRRNPSPGCRMAPQRYVLNNKHVCKPKPAAAAAAFQAHFCRGQRAAEFKRHVICLSYVRYMFSCLTCHMSGIYLVYIISGNMTYT
jgi:hypothetical protein